MTANKEDIQHIITCKDCRVFHREMIEEDRKQTKEDFRQVVKEEWECTIQTISRVDRLEKQFRWLLFSVITEGLGILYLLFKNLPK